MDLKLAGKRVLVTGGSKGIGLATVRAFLAEGADVVAVSRTKTPELEATGATFIAADLAEPDAPARAVLASGPRLDVLVNNAGGGTMPDGAFDDPLDGDDQAWAYAFGLNLDSAIRTTRAALPALLAARGAVINIGSTAARDPRGGPMPYAAAKAALTAFTRGLAEKYAGAGLRVNVVTPGPTRTDVFESKEGFIAQVADHLGLDHAAVVEAFPRQNGMLVDAIIEPAEIARAIVLLASPTMPSVIGANWIIDGGTLKAA
ncbi:SDR family NAD(P)-dependent oxidoreductase [Actinoplanes sp. NPDC049265]|uniref:SDR family NAD(P)-dependent oxidoreductase n=1 Tax=Actinoplanes sp. NPDC049265 TaxID=3363902 RepID=UPI003720F2E2